MSLDKSLRKKSGLVRARNVLKRAERIAKLKEMEKWEEGQDPFNLPKVRIFRMITKKSKKKKDEAAEPGKEPAKDEKAKK